VETEGAGQSGTAHRISAKEAESAGTVMEGVVGPSDLTIEVGPFPDR